MHLMQKCIFATRTFYEVKCSASHFPKENVQLCKNAFDAKMLCFLLCKKQRCCAKMHFCITFCFAKMHFCINKMLQMHLMRTFCFAKMHFCTNKMLQMHLMLPLHFVYKMLESGKMHFGVHFPKENVQRTFSKGKCSAYIFLWKMFSCAKMHLMPKCIFAYILRSKMFSITFSFGKCSASHFPKENVQQRTAEHFPKENVQQSKM